MARAGNESAGIVGGGIVGLAIGRELARQRPDTEIVVLEREPALAQHQTGHNSGVVHAGIYYRPGSLKADLCARGRSLLRDLCAEHGLPYVECGKVVVAVDESELARLDALERTARASRVPGLQRLDQQGLREIEPHARGIAALHSPATAITDYAAVSAQLARDITTAGGRIELSAEVTGITETVSGVDVTVADSKHRLGELVVCAGLHSDRLARLVGDDPSPRIVPFRGEYLEVTAAKQNLVNGMVYPVPDPRYPFLGVHFTRRVDGRLEVGPNAVLDLARIGSTLTWPGFWRLAARHWRTGLSELRGSLSTKAFMATAQHYVPEIGVADVAEAGSGVRAQAVARDGSLVDDFVITRHGRVTCVRNAPSPAATSSLAIAEYVAARL